jgi:hypothetical protein
MEPERLADRALGWAAWLALPVAALLFLQWPLREAVRAWSREANDVAQWLFALLVAAAVTAATRADAHPGIGRRRAGARRWAAACLLPWAAFALWEGALPVWRSVVALETFPDTFNPGYFLVKAAAWLLCALVAAQAARDLLGGRPWNT